MRDTSLQLRLLAGGAAAVFVALALAWAGLNLLFQRHVQLREAAHLTRAGEQLAAGMRLTSDGQLNLATRLADPRQSKPAGGLYWQVSDEHQAALSPSLWDQTLPASPNAPSTHWRHRSLEGPFGGHILLVERRIQPQGAARTFVVRVAQDDKDTRQATAEFSRELGVSLGLLWLVLCMAAYVQVKLGLKPLNRLPGEMERLRKSPSARLTSPWPREIRPLIEAINRLAQAREQDVARARRRAADLAHSLKTPLSALSAQSRKARAAGATEAADGLDRAITAVNAALEAELARARAAAARATSDHAHASALTVVEGLINVIERTERGESLVFDMDIPPDMQVPATGEDLSEILGALIENAARHARRQVRVTGAATNGTVRLDIEDDGEGMDGARLEAALRRGARLDEAGTGHGLGLSIVRDLAEATEAEMQFGKSGLGGLSVGLIWKEG